ncbi:unnamed protein product [Pieris macdunnoughi]|uniref:Odorant receptor n=1 Tax=Pieris macdunnoughi TaxID=345717 RepID=A0A821Y632_9NEOP|nr:unnamed protein product [Pieris macdunnoughi]
MYPNPRKDSKRAIGFGVIGVLSAPQLFIMLCDIRERIQIKDTDNLFRQLIITVLLVYVYIKIFLTLNHTKKFRAILDKVSTDYESYNHLPEDYRVIVTETIEKCKKLEIIWILMVICTGLAFILLAFLLTLLSQFTEEPRKYMIHESLIPIIEELKYETPYFEILTVYGIYIVTIVVIAYTGFDGLFYVTVLHASLKIKIYSHKITHLMDDANIPTIKAKIGSIVKEQCDVYRFIKEIQSFYQFWLASVFTLVIIQISMGLSQTKAGSENTIIYFIFATVASVNIFIPCYVASDVTSTAGEVCNFLYDCKWESVPDTSIRRSIVIMMACSQVPVHFTACGMLTISLEIFVSIMQTAYSVYTLMIS